MRTLLDDLPNLEDNKREKLWSLYVHVSNSWEKLVDVRFKLLGLVPIVSILLLLELNILCDSTIKIFGSIAGHIIIIAVFLYEERNSELHDDLISRARKIESELGIETGQFLGRKLNSSFLVKRDIALNIIYFTSMNVCLVFIVYQFLILF